jgi:hypothetical protein
LRRLHDKLIIFILLVSLFLVICVSSNSVVVASETKGIITSDITWTKDNSPYILTGPVRVDSGVTLTVEPGVTVNFDNYPIEVMGTLRAIGSIDNPIYFGNGGVNFQESSQSWVEATGSGSIIQDAVLTDFSILINYTSPKISDNSITGFMQCSRSSSVISDNRIVFTQTMYIYCSSVKLVNNVINNKAIETASTDQSTISDNTFISSGISVDSGTIISKNIFCGPYNGVRITAISGTTVEQNLIVNSNIGLFIKGNWNLVKNNTIVNNTVGIVADRGATIVNNNINGNLEYNVRLGSYISGDLNATFNWWGTTNGKEISQKIYDNDDNYNLPAVEFTPFLTEPNLQAPTVPADLSTLVSSPTPIASVSSSESPTATSNQPVSGDSVLFGLDWLGIAVVVLLCVVVVLLVLVVVFVRRRR